MLQPFKFITVVMSESTYEMKNFFSREEKSNYLYYPVALDGDTGLGYVLKTDGISDVTKVPAIIGVTMETFSQENCQTKILTHGIANMKVELNKAITAGQPVYWNSVSQGVTNETGNTTVNPKLIFPYVGTALRSVTADGNNTQYVDVLIK